MLIDQPAPLEARSIQENRAQDKRQRPPDQKRSAAVALQPFLRQMDRDTAGQQADAQEDRRLQNLPRGRSSETLTYIEDVGHHEDREDGGFRNNQAGHGHAAAIRQLPSPRGFRKRNGECAHCSCLTGTRCPYLRDASGPRVAGGWRPQGRSQSYRPAAAMLPTIPASMRPTDRSPPYRPSN